MRTHLLLVVILSGADDGSVVVNGDAAAEPLVVLRVRSHQLLAVHPGRTVRIQDRGVPFALRVLMGSHYCDMTVDVNRTAEPVVLVAGNDLLILVPRYGAGADLRAV